MRIAMFTDTYLPARDGVVSSILVTREQLKALGHEVFIFAPAPKDDRDREPGVFYFRSRTFKNYDTYGIPLYPTNKSDLLREVKAEVIHSHGLTFQGLRSLMAGRNLGLPVVVTWHTMVTEAAQYYNFTKLPEWMVTLLMKRYLRSLLARADAVVAPTQSIKEELLVMSPHIRHIEVIPTGVDSVRFSPGNDGLAIRERLGIGNDQMVLSLGRIAWEKNLDLLLEGFKILWNDRGNVKLVVAGDGPARKHYLQKAIEMGMGDRVLFPGFVSDEELASFYAACDAFTLASKFETQGLVVLEAMASGKPVSAINYRALKEIVSDGQNGFLFEDGPESWAEATGKALDASENVRAAARAKAEQYSIKTGVDHLVQLYGHAIRSKAERLNKIKR
jgi:1,2-diacylglycerol 3-alpha-glucosyltransferase